MKRKNRRSTVKEKPNSGIYVDGNIKGIGNVIGSGKSHVEISTRQPRNRFTVGAGFGA